MRMTGTVKWFSDEKGFGFIALGNGQKDVFVHHTSIRGQGFKTLATGEAVEFDLVPGAKGPAATNLVRLREGGDARDAGAPEPPHPATAGRRRDSSAGWRSEGARSAPRGHRGGGGGGGGGGRGRVGEEW